MSTAVESWRQLELASLNLGNEAVGKPKGTQAVIAGRVWGMQKAEQTLYDNATQEERRLMTVKAFMEWRSSQDAE